MSPVWKLFSKNSEMMFVKKRSKDIWNDVLAFSLKPFVCGIQTVVKILVIVSLFGAISEIKLILANLGQLGGGESIKIKLIW
jgi:putative flippase GtrA